MTLLETVVLGIVEGFTEFLPISSTAHLVITSHILGIPESAFVGSFIIAIQLGAIASVIVVYWKTILLDWETMKRVLVAFIPTAIIGYLLYKLVKGFLLENLTLIAGTLLLGGIVLILFERWQKGVSARATPLSSLGYGKVFLIGVVQSLAIIPGVSRAGATIVGGMALGLSRADIVAFSFLLAIPTMLAATVYDLYKTGSAFASSEWQLLGLGFVVSFIAAYLGVRFLVTFVQTHSFEGFGWYRVVLGLAILIVLYL